MKLYEDFARSKAKKEVEDTLTEEEEEEEEEAVAKVEPPATHIFQVLHYGVPRVYYTVHTYFTSTSSFLDSHFQAFGFPVYLLLAAEGGQVF